MSPTESMNTVPAVVHPITAPNGYGAAWSLGQTGVPVIGLDSRETYLSKSNFLTEFHVVPDVNTDPNGFVDFLIDFGRRKKQKMVLIVVADIEAFVISTNKDLLEPYYLYPYLDFTVLKKTLHRKSMFEAAVAAGNLLPQTWFPEGDSWRNIEFENLPYPVIVKSVVSRFDFDDTEIRNAWTFTNKFGKALEVHSATELDRARRTIVDDDIPVCVQERVKCEMDDLWAHHFYCRDGELIANFTGRKLQQKPPDFGTGTICRAERNPAIIDESRNFLRSIGFSGIGNIEYIRTPQGYKFVEINPRAFFWSSLATNCGVNLFRIQYDDMCGNNPAEQTHQQSDRKLIWYHLHSLPDYLAHKGKRIGVWRFLWSPRMESIMNRGDFGVSLVTLRRFVTGRVTAAGRRLTGR